MSNFSITGRLAVIGAEERKSDKFITREFVIETEGQYPQLVAFQLVQDRVSAIDAHSIGDQITVHFDLRGREWQGKYFTNLQAWKVEAIAVMVAMAAPAPTPPQSEPLPGIELNNPPVLMAAPPIGAGSEHSNDLPF